MPISAAQLDGTIVLKAPDLDLRTTLLCGQCFRWEEQGTGFFGVVSDRAAYVSLSGWNLFIDRLLRQRKTRPLSGGTIRSGPGL